MSRDTRQRGWASGDCVQQTGGVLTQALEYRMPVRRAPSDRLVSAGKEPVVDITLGMFESYYLACYIGAVLTSQTVYAVDTVRGC